VYGVYGGGMCIQALQAYDFNHLATHHECRLQIGGSDQWGNITAGIDMVLRVIRVIPVLRTTDKVIRVY